MFCSFLEISLAVDCTDNKFSPTLKPDSEGALVPLPTFPIGVTGNIFCVISSGSPEFATRDGLHY